VRVEKDVVLAKSGWRARGLEIQLRGSGDHRGCLKCEELKLGTNNPSGLCDTPPIPVLSPAQNAPATKPLLLSLPSPSPAHTLSYHIFSPCRHYEGRALLTIPFPSIEYPMVTSWAAKQAYARLSAFCRESVKLIARIFLQPYEFGGSESISGKEQ